MPLDVWERRVSQDRFRRCRVPSLSQLQSQWGVRWGKSLVVFCKLCFLSTTFSLLQKPSSVSPYLSLRKGTLWNLSSRLRRAEEECECRCTQGHHWGNWCDRPCRSLRFSWLAEQCWSELQRDRLWRTLHPSPPLLLWECSSRFHSHFRSPEHRSSWTHQTWAEHVWEQDQLLQSEESDHRVLHLLSQVTRHLYE